MSRPSDRVRVRRDPKKGHYDRDKIEAILDRSLFGHVAFVDDGHPVCIPMLYARVGKGAQRPARRRRQRGRRARRVAGEIPIYQVFGAPIPSPGLLPDVDEKRRPSGPVGSSSA